MGKSEWFWGVAVFLLCLMQSSVFGWSCCSAAFFERRVWFRILQYDFTNYIYEALVFSTHLCSCAVLSRICCSGMLLRWLFGVSCYSFHECSKSEMQVIRLSLSVSGAKLHVCLPQRCTSWCASLNTALHTWMFNALWCALSLIARISLCTQSRGCCSDLCHVMAQSHSNVCTETSISGHDIISNNMNCRLCCWVVPIWDCGLTKNGGHVRDMVDC